MLKRYFTLFLILLAHNLFSETTVLFTPSEEALLTARVASYVTAIHKKMGDSFEKGDSLLTLNPTEFEARLKRAEALVEKQRAVVEANQRLFATQILSEADLKTSIADLASFESELTTARENLESCFVYAPFAGSVVELFIDPFERTVPETPLIEIVSDTHLTAKFYLPANQTQTLKIGEIARIDVDGLVVETTITNISPVVDPANNFVRIFAAYDNRDHLLKPGVVGRLESIKMAAP